jgi:tRNA nucleotidyltransferase (CCA-adding enzyme)
MQIQLPVDVKYIINQLQEAGFEAFAVGGCVRDCLFGCVPKDWDITTSAKPEEVKAVFGHTIDTGIKHGTVTVMRSHVGYEITTYRVDGEYEDGRHPKQVSFTASLTEDLRRRDFTINAMAYNDEQGLVDCFGGEEDLKAGIIRAVGEPKERFEEDALRMLRAVRFAAALDFEIEEKTKAAVAELAGNLSKVSAERIQAELVKTLTSEHPEKFLLAYELGLTKVFLPEFDRMMETPQNNPNHCYTVGMHTIECLKETPRDKDLRLTMLFHDMGKPECRSTDEEGIDHFHGHPAISAERAGEVLRRLKFDNHTIDKVCRLCKCHDLRIEPNRKAMRRAMANIGEDLFPDFFAVQRADVLAQSDYHREDKLNQIAENTRDYEQILADKECISLKDLAVSGKDLIEAGVTPGKEVGEILNRMLNEVIEHPENNEKSALFELCLPKIP